MEEKFIVLDPTLEVEAPRVEMAKRPSRFQKVALLDNSKTNAEALLKKVAALLSEQQPDLEFKYYRKPDLSRPAPPLLLDQLAEECEVAIVGVGD